MASSLITVRSQFPILDQKIGDYPLVFLDNAATSQKPAAVIEAEKRYYEWGNANVHRAPHTLSERATLAYESVREKVRRFINASDLGEIIFTRGTTEGVNLVANSLVNFHIDVGDEILITELEHHSNIVPWQLVADRAGATVIAARVNAEGEIDLEDFTSKLSEKIKVVAFAQVSNALGTVHPVKDLVRLIRRNAPNALILIDGAQAVAHQKTDVQDLGADFYCFSGHKLYAPTGVGVLWGKLKLLQQMPPFLGGGDMIETVTIERTTYAQPPAKFEAGTPNIAGVVGLGAAIDFLSEYSWDEIKIHEKEICERAVRELSRIRGVTIIGKPKNRMSAVSFTVEGMVPMDVAVRLNHKGVAVRAGHHCCMPLMSAFGISGTVRASWSLYTTEQDIAALVSSLTELVRGSYYSKPEAAPKDLRFLKASAASPTLALKELKEQFAGVVGSQGRQELLLELGASHPNQLALLRDLTPPVQGCMSEVRLLIRDAGENRIEIATDSNAEIVRGLLEIVERVYSGQKREELKQLSAESIFSELGLPEFVSLQRRSGMSSVLTEITKNLARN